MSLDLRQPPLRLAPGHRHGLPSALRADPGELARQVRLASESPIVTALLESTDASLLVLNAHRQVVATNAGRRADGADGAALAGVLGLRPGEALGCVNAQAPGGCGTTAACETCGALGAILGCERAHRAVESECLLTLAGGAPLELHVRATPVEIAGCGFTVVSLRDVSGERRREALEQIFFHDVLNTVAGLRGWAFQLRRAGADVRRAAERVEALSRHLEREIRDQRALLLAERGALVPTIEAVAARDLVEELGVVFSHHAAARDRTLDLAEVEAGLALETDRALLGRVLVNMVRNALEATPEGGAVRVRCHREVDGAAGSVCFAVHNAGEIPRDVQLRIFQRSFSTKAARGRGLGTYGMKLLGERYLGGDVAFTSSAEAGTTFSVRLPLRAPAPTRPGSTPRAGPPATA